MGDYSTSKYDGKVVEKITNKIHFRNVITCLNILGRHIPGFSEKYFEDGSSEPTMGLSHLVWKLRYAQFWNAWNKPNFEFTYSPEYREDRFVDRGRFQVFSHGSEVFSAPIMEFRYESIKDCVHVL